ncbi:MAG: substrate-binding domain-containing protein [Alphaproteobacteria bacterium]|nr:substrate-binding domain-containing protein [Alphaproteobacteria bacterium]
MLTNKQKKISIFLIFAIYVSPLFARDYIHIVGSNTIYPFSASIAEAYAQKTGVKAPIIESMGTGGGAKLFCAGIGPNSPDILNASRALTESEIKKCREKGVDFVELTIGYDAIVLAQSMQSTPINLNFEEIYKALTKSTLSKGMFVKNYYKLWDEINNSTLKRKIIFYGPQAGSGTRDALIHMIIEKGCKELPAYQNFNERQKKDYCYSIREDEHYVEIGENYQFVFHKTNQNPDAIGIFGYSYFLSNKNVINAIPINGYLPDIKNILDHTYPLIRPLYLYIKKNNIKHIKSFKSFLKFIKKSNAFAADGFLIKIGFIPLKDNEYKIFNGELNKIIGDKNGS